MVHEFLPSAAVEGSGQLYSLDALLKEKNPE
jgi:hypothetical protein